MDVLCWVFDVAGFAVNTVLSVNLEYLVTASVFNDLVDSSRTVALRGFVKQGQVVPQRYIRIPQGQVAGLIFLVIGIGEKHGGGLIKAQYAIGLGVVDSFAIFRWQHLRVVGLLVA